MNSIIRSLISTIGRHTRLLTILTALTLALCTLAADSGEPLNRLWAWGGNTFGQLGNGGGDLQSHAVRAEVTLPPDVIALAAGGGHSLALRADGTVLAWGLNRFGQLGDGENTDRTTPTHLPTIDNAAAIACGEDHSLVLTTDGTVLAFGANTFGQLGDGSTTHRATPGQVSGIANATAIAAGDHFSLALLDDGTVRAWGGGWNGQLGNGSADSSTTPVQVLEGDGPLTGVAAIAAGARHALALKAEGGVVAWGAGNLGQLGNGTTDDATRAAPIPGLNGITFIAAGGGHCLALKAGAVWAWGANPHGQVGDGSTTNRTTPVQVNGLGEVTSIAAGRYHSLAATPQGPRAWGANVFGQLGGGGELVRATPAAVVGVQSAEILAGGFAHSVAVAAAPDLTVTVTAVPVEGGLVTRVPDRDTFAFNETATLGAHPNEGWIFAGWQGVDLERATGQILPSGSTIDVPVLGNIDAVARFARVVELTYEFNPSEGTVNGDDPGVYLAGTRVNLAAKPEWGYKFEQWRINETGNGGTTPELSIALTDDAHVEALFAEDTIGDFDGSGTVTGLDIPGFKMALAAPEAWQALNPGRNVNFVGDTNGDGVFNGLDIPAFKQLLGQ